MRKATLLRRIAAQRADYVEAAGLVSGYLTLFGRLQALWRSFRS